MEGCACVCECVFKTIKNTTHHHRYVEQLCPYILMHIRKYTIVY